MITGAEYVLRFLNSKRLPAVFGYPGAPLLALYDAFARRGTEFEHILCRHEQGAVHAACGMARASGRPGVVIATSGPGASNLMTGLADAYLDSIPLLAITGQVSVGAIGRDAFQEADIMGMTLPITKHNYLIKSADHLPAALEEAWRIASSGRRGPVLVDISRDVFDDPVDETQQPIITLPRFRAPQYPLDNRRIAELKAAIERSYRPVILAGGGVAAGNASEALTAFARQSEIPVVTTLMGMGIILGRGARIYGMTGRHGGPAAKAALDQSDLVIAVGTRFSDRTIASFRDFSQNRRIIHCDIDPAEISKNVTAHLPVSAGAAEFFTTLVASDIRYNSEAIAEWNAKLTKLGKRPKIGEEPEDTLRKVLRCIDSVVREQRDTIYVTDVGLHQMAAALELEPVFERGFITSGGLGAMGFGLPAAIGASFGADPEVKRIVLVCGDGGFQMTMQELATLDCARLPIKIFTADNSALGMIRSMQDSDYEGRHFACELTNPDLCMIARAYGIPTCELDGANDEQIRKILGRPGHELIRVFC